MTVRTPSSALAQSIAVGADRLEQIGHHEGLLLAPLQATWGWPISQIRAVPLLVLLNSIGTPNGPGPSRRSR